MSPSSVAIIGHGTLLACALLATSALAGTAQSLPSAASHVTHGNDVRSSRAAAMSVAPPGTTISPAPPESGSSVANESAGLVIIPRFDSSITNSPNEAAIEAAINEAISRYESMFSDPITVSIVFRYATTEADGTPFPSSGVARSSYVYYTIPWNDYVIALRADALTVNDATANNSFPNTPLSPNVAVSAANGRAIGLNTGPALYEDGSVGEGGPYDGIVTINAGVPVEFTRPVSGNSFDAITLIEHEIDEILGLGSHINDISDLRPQDLYSWYGPESRNTTADGNRYFSIDGARMLVAFNQKPNGDFGDWASEACPSTHPLVQDAFGCRGQSIDISLDSPEGITLDVLGYDLVGAARPAPTARPSEPAADQSVAWQNNPQHDGNDSISPLAPPLTVRWQKDLSSLGVTSISYPLIADGRIIVTTRVATHTKSVRAFDEFTGKQLWAVDIPGGTGFLNAAYDDHKIFVLSHEGVIQALDAATGTQLWTRQLPSQHSFTSPPTASNGFVFVTGAGGGGTLFAVDENEGAVRWTAELNIAGHSAATVAGSSVFVSNSCPYIAAFTTTNGQQQWQSSGSCQSASYRTPVVHFGKVYARAPLFVSPSGVILDAKTGTQVGTFDSDVPPAFVGNLGVYLYKGTLSGVDIRNGKVLWTFTGDGHLTSAPLIVNRTIYIGSSSGLLYGLDVQGHEVWSTHTGAPIAVPEETYAYLTTGFGSGDGLLVVPAGPKLVVYCHSDAAPQNISTRGIVSSDNYTMIGGFIITGKAPKKVVIRALGPSTGVTGAVADPILELHKPDGSVVTNDNWKTDLAAHRSQEVEIRATGVPPTNDFESAIVETLPPGDYTAVVRPKKSRGGVGLVEVYDLDSSGASTLANISTRGFVDKGDNVMIGGFIVGPQHAAASKIVVRAIGTPTDLLNGMFNPLLELHDAHGNLIALNDDWQDDPTAAEITTYHLAPTNLHDSAVIRILLPGTYTAVVRGYGVGLVEVYNVR